MAATPSTGESAIPAFGGKIIEAEIKVSVDPAMALPLACALYAIERPEGVWLCAYYGSNRSVFDYLPQKGAEIDAAKLGIAFHTRQFVRKEAYQPATWEEFRKTHWMAYAAHAA